MPIHTTFPSDHLWFNCGLMGLRLPAVCLSCSYLLHAAESLKASRVASSQEIPCTWRNPKIHYRVHKCPPPVPILSQLDPVHIPTSHFLKIHLNIILPSTPVSPQCMLTYHTHNDVVSFVSLPTTPAGYTNVAIGTKLHFITICITFSAPDSIPPATHSRRLHAVNSACTGQLIQQTLLRSRLKQTVRSFCLPQTGRFVSWLQVLNRMATV
jgi:hypothetical protein